MFAVSWQFVRHSFLAKGTSVFLIKIIHFPGGNMKFLKILILFLLAQLSVLNYAMLFEDNLQDIIRTAVYLCDQLNPIESFDDIAQRFANSLDESGINPFEKDQNGNTLSQIAEKKYNATQKPLCKLVFEELKKYEERYIQKHV